MFQQQLSSLKLQPSNKYLNLAHKILYKVSSVSSKRRIIKYEIFINAGFTYRKIYFFLRQLELHAKNCFVINAINLVDRYNRIFMVQYYSFELLFCLRDFCFIFSIHRDRKQYKTFIIYQKFSQTTNLNKKKAQTQNQTAIFGSIKLTLLDRYWKIPFIIAVFCYCRWTIIIIVRCRFAFDII